MDYGYILQSFFEGLKILFHVNMLLMMLGGVIFGLVIGIIPGMGGTLALILILPFVTFMDAKMALPLMIAVHSVVGTGGGISSILMAVPGTVAASATLLDGYPMTQKGEAGRALGASRMADLVGDVLSVIMAIVIIPAVLAIVFAVTTADMVFIVLVGLAFIGILGSESMSKGIVSGLLGLMLSFVGFQAGTGVARFTFGSLILYDGIPMPPIGLGLFAFPTIVQLLREGGSIAPTDTKVDYRQVWQGCMDVFIHFGLCVRTAIIGFLIGMAPGIGGDAASFICYAQAKALSKHPEEFGKGAVAGVIAPQCAENAKEAGALITTMALGLPGSSGMAILMMAYLMLGFTPGPQMLKEHLDIGFSMILMIIVSGAAASFITLAFSKQMCRVALVPARYMVPLILSAVLIGSYAGEESMFDVFLTLIFGVVGICMEEYGYSRPSLTLGLVLGFLFEKSLFIAYGLKGWLFFNSPISYVMMLVLVSVLAREPLKRLYRKLKTA